MSTPTPNVPAKPTQVARPWRTTLRTAVQVAIPTLITLGVVVPEIVKIILEESGQALPENIRGWLLAASAVVVAVAAILTRIMAIPAVELLLRRYLPGLAAEPKRKTTDYAA